MQSYNHIGSSQLQALDPGMENSHFYGYPANGDLMDGPYIPEHFAGKLIINCLQAIILMYTYSTVCINPLIQCQDQVHMEMGTVSMLSLPLQAGEELTVLQCFRYM